MKCHRHFDHTVYFIPWEFPTASISTRQLRRQLADAVAVRYVSAECRLQIVRNHAEIPIAAGSSLPVGFQNVRIS